MGRDRTGASQSAGMPETSPSRSGQGTRSRKRLLEARRRTRPPAPACIPPALGRSSAQRQAQSSPKPIMRHGRLIGDASPRTRMLIASNPTLCWILEGTTSSSLSDGLGVAELLQLGGFQSARPGGTPCVMLPPHRSSPERSAPPIGGRGTGAPQPNSSARYTLHRLLWLASYPDDIGSVGINPSLHMALRTNIKQRSAATGKQHGKAGQPAGSPTTT